MKLTLPVFCIFLSAMSLAQAPGYFVDLVRGEAYVIRNKKTLALVPRSKLNKDDVIVIRKENVKVSVGKAGKEVQYLELTRPGNYALAEQFNNSKHKAHGMMEKYVHFLWHHIAFPEKDLSKLKSSDLGSWGGVVRAGCNLNLFPYNNLQFSADEISFRWSSVKGVKEYRLILFGQEENELLKISVRDTQLVISSRFFMYNEDKHFYWSVNTIDEHCKSVPKQKFTILSLGEYQEKVNDILKSIEETDTNRFNLIAAEKLESNGFYEEAAAYLKKAVLDK